MGRAKKRTDSASRVIWASLQRIYKAFLDPGAVASWRPAEGMKCQIFAFDAREGGIFRRCFSYTDSDHPVCGKTSETCRCVRGGFLQLVANERIVERFESDDPAFAGAMTITTTLVAVSGGIEATLLCEGCLREYGGAITGPA
jgi:uncharacterized protein YndB with AHSA1/START domain